MSTNLTLELITEGSGLLSNLAPLLHENSKLWPYQKAAGRQAADDRSFAAHDLLARAAVGITLRDEQQIRSSTPAGYVPLATVASLLTRSMAARYDQFIDMAADAFPRLNCYLLGWRVAGLDSGSYFYWPDEPKLIPVRKVSCEYPEERIAMEAGPLSSGAGLVVLTGPVRYDGFDNGERYYRDLLVLSGYVVHDIVKTALHLGLSAGAVARFLDDPLAIELGLDPSFDQPLAVVAFSAIGDGK